MTQRSLNLTRHFGIGIKGLKGSGKTEASKILQEFIQPSIELAYGNVCIDRLNRITKGDVKIDDKDDPIIRKLLQVVGEELHKDGFFDKWADNIISGFGVDFRVFIFSSVRYNADAQYIRDKFGGLILEMIPRENILADSHVSEWGQQMITPDFYLRNNQDGLSNLRRECRTVSEFIIQHMKNKGVIKT